MFARHAANASIIAMLLSGHAMAQYRHASTAYEGAMRGEADFLRAEGESQYWYSLAALNYAAAYDQYLWNCESRVVRRQEIKALSRAYRDAGRNRLTLAEASHFAQAVAPKKLSDEQFDRATGKLNWPHALREARYSILIGKLEKLLAAKYSGFVSTDEEINGQIDDVSRELLASLKANLHHYPKANDFIGAKRFLESLMHEEQPDRV